MVLGIEKRILIGYITSGAVLVLTNELICLALESIMLSRPAYIQQLLPVIRCFIYLLLSSIFLWFILKYHLKHPKKLLKDYQNLFEHFTAPVLLVENLNNKIIGMNKPARALFGVPKNATAGLKFQDLQIGEPQSGLVIFTHSDERKSQLFKQVIDLNIPGIPSKLIKIEQQVFTPKTEKTLPISADSETFTESLYHIQMNPNGQWLHMSPSLKNRLHTTESNSFLELILPDARAEFTDAMHRIFTGKKKKEMLLLPMSGKYEPLHFAWEFSAVSVNGVFRIQGIGIDISPDFNKLSKSINEHKLLKGLLENIRVSCWTTDFHNLHILYANSYTETMMGKPLRQLMSDTSQWLNLVVPEDRKIIYEQLQALETHDQAHYTYNIQLENGSIKCIETHNYLERSATGEPLFIHGLCYEKDFLKEPEQHNFEWLDAISVPMMAVLPLGKMLFINHSMSNALGVGRARLISSNISDWLIEGNWTSILEQRSENPSSGRFGHLEIEWKGLPGKTEVEIAQIRGIYFLRLLSPAARVHGGNPDETSLHIFNQITSQSPDMIWSVNLNLEIQVANQALLNAVNLGGSSVYHGLFLHALVDNHEAMNWLITRLNRVFEGETVRDEFDILNMGWKGGVREFLLFPLYDHERRITGAGCIARDIRHYKSLEQALHEKNQVLENLIYHAAHHVRSPLANAMGIIQLLNDPASSPEQREEARQRLGESLQKLDETIRATVNQARNLVPDGRRGKPESTD